MLLKKVLLLSQAYEDRNAKKNKSEAAYYSQHKTYMAEG